ncbi:MAG: HAD family hydrolase [Actinomycetota bacterium]
MSDKVVFWDFDGTLAHREGYWSGTVYRVLSELEPDHGIEHDELRKGFRDTFPWHAPNDPHPHLSDPDEWWARIDSTMHAALVSAGLSEGAATRIVAASRAPLVDPASWEVFPDAAPALRRVREAGWANYVLSNHAPELPEIVTGTGLGEHIDGAVTSATAGYEKPHPEIFRAALRHAGDPRDAWMVGDNPMADVAGAELVGIPAILVRTERFDDDYVRMVERFWGPDFMPGWREHVHRVARDLHGAADIILGTD